MLAVFVPNPEHLVNKVLGCRVPVRIGVYDSLHALRVKDRLDGFLVIPNQVVVKLDAPWLLLVNDDISDLQELTLDLGVVRPELACAINRASALVSLQNYKEITDEFLTLRPQLLKI